MAEITGADTKIALVVAGTFGTEEEVGTGDQMEVESLSQSTNPEELSASPIGSGQLMQNDAQQGALSPSIEIEKIDHFNDAGVAAEAVFWQGESVMNMGSSAYTHSFMRSAFNQKWATLAHQLGSNTAAEFPSCAVTRLQLTYDNPPNYARKSISLIANDRDTAPTTNTYDVLQATTLADTERVVLQADDEFLINTRGGSALASPTDRIAITSIVIEYTAEQDFAREIKGSAGLGEPFPSGNPPFETTVTVTLRALEDATYFTAAAAGTEYKAQLTVTGSLIGGSQYKKWVRCFPCLKLIQDPQYGLTSPASNPLTLVFKALAVSSAPSGMWSTYPYAMVTNGKSTAYLA